MNEKEAREIIKKGNSELYIGRSPPNCYRAAGYLEAIEKANKPIEMLKKINENASYDVGLQEYMGQKVLDQIKEILAKWEKEK